MMNSDINRVIKTIRDAAELQAAENAGMDPHWILAQLQELDTCIAYYASQQTKSDEQSHAGSYQLPTPTSKTEVGGGLDSKKRAS